MDQVGSVAAKADGSYDIIPTRKNGANWLYRADAREPTPKPAAAAILSGTRINQGYASQIQ